MKEISVIGNTWIGIVMIGAVSVFYFARRQVPEVVFILATLSIFVLTAFLKVLVARPRPPYFFPDSVDIFQSINQYSFPSGHVLFFVVFFGFIAYLAWLHQTGFARNICYGNLLCPYPAHRAFTGISWGTLGK